MPIRHSYADHGDACAAAQAMDVVGDRWSVPLIRELMLGPKTYSGLQQSLHGIAPDVLVKRLRHLESEGVLTRTGQPRGATYQLTEWGQAFRPVLEALGRWSQAGGHDASTGELTPDAAAMAMLTMATSPSIAVDDFDLVLVDPRAPAGPEGVYRIHWVPGGLQITRHQNLGADQATFYATTWARLFVDPSPFVDPELPLLIAEGEGEHRARTVLADQRRQRPSGMPATQLS